MFLSSPSFFFLNEPDIHSSHILVTEIEKVIQTNIWNQNEKSHKSNGIVVESTSSNIVIVVQALLCGKSINDKSHWNPGITKGKHDQFNWNGFYGGYTLHRKTCTYGVLCFKLLNVEKRLENVSNVRMNIKVVWTWWILSQFWNSSRPVVAEKINAKMTSPD